MDIKQQLEIQKMYDRQIEQQSLVEPLDEFNDMTRDELKAYLDDKGIHYAPNMRKSGLIELARG